MQVIGEENEKEKDKHYAEEKWNKEHPPESLPWLLIKSVVSIFIAVLLLLYVIFN